MSNRTGKIHIGTSGWNYDAWLGPFYPPKTPARNMLACYSGVFSTVEVNNSFYNLPSEKSIARWVDTTPDDFLFACKASRFITHMKKLKDPEDHVPRLMETLAHFGRKLGPILFQLPPNWRMNKQRLATFLETLPSGYRYTFEFRDRSWLDEEVYELLRGHNAANCFYDFKGYRSPEEVTADFVYMRLHGPRRQPYQGSYDGRTLAAYGRKFRRWAMQGRDVYCYFDNDQKGFAAADAKDILQKLDVA